MTAPTNQRKHNLRKYNFELFMAIDVIWEEGGGEGFDLLDSDMSVEGFNT